MIPTQSITNTKSERIANSALGITLWKKELCPAWQKRREKCNKRNHFATVCWKGQALGVHRLSERPQLDSDEQDDSYESSDYEFLAVTTVEPSTHAIEQTSGYAREIQWEMMINDKKIKFQIDYGASTSIITKCQTTRSRITPSNKTLKMWNGTEMKPLGTKRLKVTNPKTGKKYSIEFVVVPDDSTPLLGAGTAQQMELITVHEDYFVSVPPPHIMWGHPKHCNSWRASPMLSRSFCKRSGKPTWYSPPDSWWKCRTFCNGFATDPDCPEREVQSWTTPLRESRSTDKSQWAYGMGEHCCYCYKEVRCPKNMHRSTTVEPSLKKRNPSAANPRRLNTRAGSREELFNRWSYHRVLTLRAWRQVPSLDYLCNPLWKISVEKTPFWSINIKRDLPETGESSPRRTGRNT